MNGLPFRLRSARRPLLPASLVTALLALPAAHAQPANPGPAQEPTPASQAQAQPAGETAPAPAPTQPATPPVTPPPPPPATTDPAEPAEATDEKLPENTLPPPVPVLPTETIPFETPATPVEVQPPGMSFLDRQLPLLPWQADDTPDLPDWAADASQASPFQRPSLGTPLIGGAGPAGGGGGGGAGRRGRVSTPIPLGPFDLRPSLGYRTVYGTGLGSGSDRNEDSWINTVDPGIAITAGPHWSISYDPSIRFYNNDDYENTVNHHVTLGGWASWQNWVFRVNHSSSITDDPLIETARQTDQVAHSTSIGATWNRSQRGVYNFGLGEYLRFSDDNSDVYSWSSNNSYDYQIRPKLRVGVGVNVGYDSVEPGTDMIHESITGRLSGPLGNKLRYNLSAGGNFRQFTASEAPTAINPLVAFSLAYQVLERTAFSTSLTHDTSTSYFANQFTEHTSIQATLSQSLTEIWSASVSGGFRFTSYQSTLQADTIEREDSTRFANVSLNGRVLPRVRLSLFYSYRANDSDNDGFGLDSHQFGLSVNWAL